MPSFVLYPLALLGLISALAFTALMLLVFVEHRHRDGIPAVRAAHRRTRV